MKNYIILTLLAVSMALGTTARTWRPDSLAGYERSTVVLPEGRQCTVVRKLSHKPTSRAVLYVHGYNDYFFQAHEGNVFVDSLYDFYAVDLHGYGRSLKAGETPYQATAVSDYYPDLDSALTIMRHSGAKQIVLMGHSTGGLVTACYLNEKPRKNIDVLILNSPFFDWNFNGFMRKVVIPTVAAVGGIFPNIKISQGDGSIYAQSLLKGYHGRWTFNTEWKTMKPRKVTSGWVHYIETAQNQLKDRPGRIKIPILLMHSARSYIGSEWSDDAMSADAVLNVADMSRIGRTLGPHVTDLTVEGALHDIFLSNPAVVKATNGYMFAWLKRNM